MRGVNIGAARGDGPLWFFIDLLHDLQSSLEPTPYHWVTVRIQSYIPIHLHHTCMHVHASVHCLGVSHTTNIMAAADGRYLTGGITRRHQWGPLNHSVIIHHVNGQLLF